MPILVPKLYDAPLPIACLLIYSEASRKHNVWFILTTDTFRIPVERKTDYKLKFMWTERKMEILEKIIMWGHSEQNVIYEPSLGARQHVLYFLRTVTNAHYDCRCHCQPSDFRHSCNSYRSRSCCSDV